MEEYANSNSSSNNKEYKAFMGKVKTCTEAERRRLRVHWYEFRSEPQLSAHYAEEPNPAHHP